MLSAPAPARVLAGAATSSAGHDAVIVDMSETACCDSTGLNVLVRAYKQLSGEGRQLRLVIREPTLLRIFKVTGVDTMWRPVRGRGPCPPPPVAGPRVAEPIQLSASLEDALEGALDDALGARQRAARGNARRAGRAHEEQPQP